MMSSFVLSLILLVIGRLDTHIALHLQYYLLNEMQMVVVASNTKLDWCG
jgi:hypothetical protein